MSEYEKEDDLSIVSNDDLEQQIDDDDEMVLKEKQEEDSSSDEDNDDNEEDEENDDDDNDVENEVNEYNNDLNSEKDIKDLDIDLENEMTNNDDYSSDNDSDLYDEDEFKKLDQELKQDYLLEYHQESKIHNFDEILSLAKVIRDDKNVIIDELHKTIPILTKYEKTRILGERTKQINHGNKPFIDTDENVIDGYLIALKELEEKKIPFIIRRPLPSGGSEYWHLRDLEVI